MAESTLYFPEEEAEKLEPHLPPRVALLQTPAAGSQEEGEKVEEGTREGEGAGGLPSPRPRPFVTLTFATSLDSMLALGPGIRTALSGPRSKAMTHYLRSRHDAICVGVGTAIADDPGLNCRLAAADATTATSPASSSSSTSSHVSFCVRADEDYSGRLADDIGGGGHNNHATGAPISSKLATTATATANAVMSQQPRPIIVDPRLRWDFTAESKVLRLAREGKGLAPYIITLVRDPPREKKRVLEALGGKYIVLDSSGASPDRDGSGNCGRDCGRGPERCRAKSADMDKGKGSSDAGGNARLGWGDILSAIRREDLDSVMVEGGGHVINSLLSENASLVDSVIVTIAPTWLGQGGVTVSPPRSCGHDRPVARLTDTLWMPLGEDVVLCGRLAP
ncbi:bacterial bifunctional deaminase-reductase [Xylariaceae sp. FL0594]|nr:bacterial bifunctional deaminase-reductase [Xylariaceae sp. FL0594]